MPPRRTFGHSWWGEAWTRALETRARIDPNRLPRGRTYARHDRVRALLVHPGEVTAFVQGSRTVPYRVRVGVRRFTDEEWDAAIAAIAAKAGHAAALLDGELDPAVVEDCAAAGVELLPGPGDIRPHCSCPDWADPCKHAAAVVYLVADVLDDDPFALLRLRGRERDEILAAVRVARRATAGGGSGPGAEDGGEGDGDGEDVAVDPIGWPDDPGERARDAWARAPGPPPPPGPVADRPGVPAPWATDPPPGAPFTGAGLHELAGDAAHRAWLQLGGEGTSALSLGPAADLSRRAAHLLDDPRRLAALARAAGVRPADLTRTARAWQHGGPAGLAVLDQVPWRPSMATMADARRRIAEVVGPRMPVAVRDERITVGPTTRTRSSGAPRGPEAHGIQLRLGHDGRWWRLEKRNGRWCVVAPPADAPDDLLA